LHIGESGKARGKSNQGIQSETIRQTQVQQNGIGMTFLIRRLPWLIAAALSAASSTVSSP
jgi:hypothetical protein